MSGITLLWRLLLILHFSPQTHWLPERAVCSKTFREQPFLTPFPNVTIQGFPVHTPEKNHLLFSQNQAVSVDVKPGRPETEPDSHLQQSPPHPAGEHTLQGRCGTLKQNCFHSETNCTLICLFLACLSIPPALRTCLFDLAAQGEQVLSQE